MPKKKLPEVDLFKFESNMEDCSTDCMEIANNFRSSSYSISIEKAADLLILCTRMSRDASDLAVMLQAFMRRVQTQEKLDAMTAKLKEKGVVIE